MSATKRGDGDQPKADSCGHGGEGWSVKCGCPHLKKNYVIFLLLFGNTFCPI